MSSTPEITEAEVTNAVYDPFDLFTLFAEGSIADGDQEPAPALPVANPSPPTDARHPADVMHLHVPAAPTLRRIGNVAYFAAKGKAYRLRPASDGSYIAVSITTDERAAAGATMKATAAQVWHECGAGTDPAPPRVEHGQDHMGKPTAAVRGENEQSGLSLSIRREQFTTACPRCGGSGELKSYRRVNGGVCFRCEGDGIGMYYTIDEAVNAVYRLDIEARARADEKAIAAVRKKWRLETFDAAHPDLAELFAQATHLPEFAIEMRKLICKGRTLTECQLSTLRQMATEDRTRRATAAEREAERVAKVEASRPAGAEGETVSVTGKVTTRAEYSSGPDYRPRRKVRIVVDDEAGVQVIAFVSTRAAAGVRLGNRVTVTGSVADPTARDLVTLAIQSRLIRAKFTTT
ncbi:hypothetical protein [Streptomyces decoyicus]